MVQMTPFYIMRYTVYILSQVVMEMLGKDKYKKYIQIFTL